MMKATGLPVWEGGLQDQPHIWLGQYGLIDKTFRLFEAIRLASEAAETERRRNQQNGPATER